MITQFPISSGYFANCERERERESLSIAEKKILTRATLNIEHKNYSSINDFIENIDEGKEKEN